jgi:hypothetical protein
MAITYNSFGYSSSLAEQAVGNNPTASTISFTETVKWKWEDNKRTNQAEGYKYDFVVIGQNPFTVTFSERQNINQFDEVVFKNLEACNVRGKLHFRADSVTAVKKGDK